MSHLALGRRSWTHTPEAEEHELQAPCPYSPQHSQCQPIPKEDNFATPPRGILMASSR